MRFLCWVLAVVGSACAPMARSAGSEPGTILTVLRVERRGAMSGQDVRCARVASPSEWRVVASEWGLPGGAPDCDFESEWVLVLVPPAGPAGHLRWFAVEEEGVDVLTLVAEPHAPGGAAVGAGAWLFVVPRRSAQCAVVWRQPGSERTLQVFGAL